MPIRTSSFTKRIAANGQALHRARAARTETAGAAQTPTDAEAALIEERRILKEERAHRKAQALQPGPTALDKLVRTHRPAAKDKPKVTGEAQPAKETKKPKAQRTRAEKQAEKAAAVEASRRSPKKPAK